MTWETFLLLLLRSDAKHPAWLATKDTARWPQGLWVGGSGVATLSGDLENPSLRLSLLACYMGVIPSTLDGRDQMRPSDKVSVKRHRAPSEEHVKFPSCHWEIAFCKAHPQARPHFKSDALQQCLTRNPSVCLGDYCCPSHVNSISCGCQSERKVHTRTQPNSPHLREGALRPQAAGRLGTWGVLSAQENKS